MDISTVITILVVVFIIYLLLSGYPMFVPLVAATFILLELNAPMLSPTMIIQQIIEGENCFLYRGIIKTSSMLAYNSSSVSSLVISRCSTT